MMDISIKLSGGNILKGFIDSPGDKARGGIILVHGLGEHTGRYNHWVRLFNSRDIACAGVDLPGHGRSDGKRGFIRNYSVTDEMLDIITGEYRKTFPELPFLLYGHSLGGNIVLDYILRKKPDLNGAIISSPWIKLAFEPDRLKVKLAAVMKTVFPALTQPSGLVTSHLSHDQSVVDKYRNDPLVHDRISVSLFHSVVSAARYSLENAHSLHVPVLMIHGSDDQIVSPAGSREFAQKSVKTTLRTFEGGYHELHNEPFRGEVFSVIMEWLEKILKQ